MPRGGVEFANYLQPYATGGIKKHGVLVVDDVWTTGASLRNFMCEVGKTERVVGAAVLFDRGGIPLPPGIRAVFTLNNSLFNF